ncbi:MAG: hypothetical protein ACI4QV_06640 [Acutalibacteraceae bacterium]
MTAEYFIDGRKYDMRLLSALEKLQAYSASAGLSSYLADNGLEESGLSYCAVLASMALSDNDAPVFADGYTALKSLSEEQLESIKTAYDNLARSSSGTLISQETPLSGGAFNTGGNVPFSDNYEELYSGGLSDFVPTAEDISEILERETIRRFRSFGES